jgi:hypothetical protein
MQNILHIFAYCIYLLVRDFWQQRYKTSCTRNKLLHKMAIPKTEGRDEFRDALAPVVAELKKGGRDYGREAALLTPTIDRVKLQQAVNGRTVYWPAVKALKKVVEHRQKALATA